MPKRRVFYSFHFNNDVFRVQLIRNMGALDGNQPVSVNEWEEVKRGGDRAIKKWIDDNMFGKSCVVVLIGEETYKRPWIIYEIKKAYNDGKAIAGIYIHNLKDIKNGTCSKGPNPFDYIKFEDGTMLSSIIKCHNPNPKDAYNDIKDNLEDWIEEAIESCKGVN